MHTTTIRRRTLRAATLLAAIASIAAVATTSAGAASPPTWSAAIPADTGGTPTAVTCASLTLCVGVDHQGKVFSSATPASATGWAVGPSTGVNTPSAVSCPQGPGTAFCVAVGAAGTGATAAGPAGPWTPLAMNDGTHAINGISCPSTSLCVAVDDNGHIDYSTTPATGGWTPLLIDGTNALNAISCPTSGFCAAVDVAGNVLVSSSPPTGTWTKTLLTSSASLKAISCNSSELCVATASDGGVWATANATTAPVTWSQTPLDTAGNAPLAVSCSNTGLCVLADATGTVFATDTPTAGRPNWAASGIDAGHPLTGVSCLDGGLCIAVDGSGNAFAATVPAPSAVTGTGSAASQTNATLTATVDPGDATIGDCHFVYGTSVSYGSTAPCASTPAPGAGAQAVSAQITGLTASTTYHFAIVASSGVATGTGADGTFTTPAPLKANPSLSGTPAVGSTLTCHPNVTTTATETVGYAWLNDTLPISGATASTYVVAASDQTHHLSCQVTIAGDGGSTTATSGFDSIPAQSGGKVVESFAGTAKNSGATVRAPVTCSVEAIGHCTFTLTLTTSQTVHAKRTTVTVGSKTASVAKGAKATLSVSLNSTGHSMLAKQHKLAVTFTVKGTLLGTLTATLETAKFTMATKPAHKKQRRHATHARH